MTTETTPAAAAGTWLLGEDLRVNRMGYGAMQLAGPGVFGPPADPDRARAALRRSVELGVNHIDTSDFYGPYVTNEILRAVLSPYPEGMVLVTKVGARRDESGGWHPWMDPDGLKQAVHENLEHLGVDRLDVVNLRVAGPRLPADTPLGEQFEVLAGLREEGLIRHLGLSNVTPGQLDQALAIAPVACVQNRFNIWHHEDDALVDRCNEQMIAYVPFFPLGSAFEPMGRPGRWTGGGCQARCERAPGRAGVVAAPVAGDPGDPGLVRPGARRGQRRRGGAPARPGRPGGAGGRLAAGLAGHRVRSGAGGTTA